MKPMLALLSAAALAVPAFSQDLGGFKVDHFQKAKTKAPVPESSDGRPDCSPAPDPDYLRRLLAPLAPGGVVMIGAKYSDVYSRHACPKDIYETNLGGNGGGDYIEREQYICFLPALWNWAQDRNDPHSSDPELMLDIALTLRSFNSTSGNDRFKEIGHTAYGKKLCNSLARQGAPPDGPPFKELQADAEAAVHAMLASTAKAGAQPVAAEAATTLLGYADSTQDDAFGPDLADLVSKSQEPKTVAAAADLLSRYRPDRQSLRLFLAAAQRKDLSDQGRAAALRAICDEPAQVKGFYTRLGPSLAIWHRKWVSGDADLDDALSVTGALCSGPAGPLKDEACNVKSECLPKPDAALSSPN